MDSVSREVKKKKKNGENVVYESSIDVITSRELVCPADKRVYLLYASYRVLAVKI